MSLVSLNDARVARGTLSMPLVGAWTADLLVENDDDEPSGAVVLSIAGELELHGTVLRSLNHRGMAQVRVVGGAGGLQKSAAPKFYRAAKIGDVLRDLVTDAGETLSDTSDSSALSASLDYWTTITSPTGLMVAALMPSAPGGTGWRVLPDGSLWVGPETWPDSGITEWAEISEDGCNAAIEVGLDAPVLVPGTLLGERKAGSVEHTIEADAIRSIVFEVVT